MRRRRRPPRDFLRLEPKERPLAQLLGADECVVPRADLRGARRRPEPPVLAEMSIDAVRCAEGADLGHARRGGASEMQRLFDAAELLEREELRPPREDESAVASTRARAADIRLDKCDVDPRLAHLQLQRGPKSGEAAADDAHIGADLALNRRRIFLAGARPVAVGGDHSITLPILRALGSPERPLALVHLDAHLDTYDRMDTWFGVVDSAAHWASKAVHERLVDPGRSTQLGMRGHMSPWTQANVSDELGYLVLEKARCDDLGVEGVVTAILERVGDCPVYVSFDLDCLDPGIAPGVSNLETDEYGFTMSP